MLEGFSLINLASFFFNFFIILKSFLPSYKYSNIYIIIHLIRLIFKKKSNCNIIVIWWSYHSNSILQSRNLNINLNIIFCFKTKYLITTYSIYPTKLLLVLYYYNVWLTYRLIYNWDYSNSLKKKTSFFLKAISLFKAL